MIKIKVTHAKGKQTFRAKGDLVWTVKRTDEEGNALNPMQDISPELCLKHLAQFIREASRNKGSKVGDYDKKPNAKAAAKKAAKLTEETSAEDTATSLRSMAMDEDI